KKRNEPESQTLLPKLVENYEKELLIAVLEKNNWNCSDAAREMGIHRSAIYKKIKKYGLTYQVKKTGIMGM
ncbi:MAG: hypothetical protein LBT51_00395, partial [Fusobacteriaceae bacterium]|nr:hypothetical protein [Fusobacteriaceae bacterium]